LCVGVDLLLRQLSSACSPRTVDGRRHVRVCVLVPARAGSVRVPARACASVGVEHRLVDYSLLWLNVLTTQRW
jgi:hypothetical protein